MQFYEETQKIKSSMVWRDSRLSLCQLPVLFQDLATEHSALMGVDGPTLREKSNAFWAITKTKIIVQDLPALFDAVLLRTWPNKPSAITCERNCTLEKDGRVLAGARTQWVLLDCDTHRIRKLDSTCYPRDLKYCEDVAVQGPYSRVTADFAPEDFSYEHTVRASDIDISDHTNNAVSFRLLMDALPQEKWAEFARCEINIHYLNESRMGDHLRIFARQTDEGAALLAKKADETPVVSMAIKKL